jgi:hypothetical protein
MAHTQMRRSARRRGTAFLRPEPPRARLGRAGRLVILGLAAAARGWLRDWGGGGERPYERHIRVALLHHLPDRAHNRPWRLRGEEV